MHISLDTIDNGWLLKWTANGNDGVLFTHDPISATNVVMIDLSEAESLFRKQRYDECSLIIQAMNAKFKK